MIYVATLFTDIAKVIGTAVATAFGVISGLYIYAHFIGDAICLLNP